MKTVLWKEDFTICLKENLLAMAKGSIDSNQYRYFYIEHPDGPKDLVGNGDLACAFFLSSLLTVWRLSKKVHTTIDQTIVDIVKSGWIVSPTPCAGAVVVWGHKLSSSNNLMHRHIGLCLDDKNAVSTCPKARSPQMHGIWSLKTHTGETREVVEYYIHPKLHS